MSSSDLSIIRFVAIVFLVSVCLCSGGYAAGAENIIKGTVTDPGGAAIHGASVEVVANGAIRKAAITNQNGEYSLSLEPGTYLLRVIATGFSSLQKQIEVFQDHNPTFDFMLEIGPATAVVNITDGSFDSAVSEAERQPDFYVPRVLLAP